MRIAQVVSLNEPVPPESKNGLEFVVSWLTEELVARGHEVTLFAPGNSQTKAKLAPLLPKSFSELNIKGHNITYFSIWNTLISGIRESEFDIIHCHNGNGHVIAPFVKCPVVETIHNTFDNMFLYNALPNKDVMRSLKPILNELSKVHYIAVSKRQEKLFEIYSKFYYKKHSTVHNGIPFDKFSLNEKPKDYLFYIGYINKNKGADVAVQVAKKLDMKLILAGNNFGEEEFFNEHIRPFLNDKIEYIGAVDFETKNELYRNAVATLAPIHWEEPFGLTIVESLACGTPVISFNKGASAEIIEEGKTGFIVDTVDEMVEAVKKIGSINRKKCRDVANKKFDVKNMVDKYEKIYKKLVN